MRLNLFNHRSLLQQITAKIGGTEKVGQKRPMEDGAGNDYCELLPPFLFVVVTSDACVVFSEVERNQFRTKLPIHTSD
jgi:hypothetical protein